MKLNAAYDDSSNGAQAHRDSSKSQQHCSLQDGLPEIQDDSKEVPKLQSQVPVVLITQNGSDNIESNRNSVPPSKQPLYVEGKEDLEGGFESAEEIQECEEPCTISSGNQSNSSNTAAAAQQPSLCLTSKSPSANIATLSTSWPAKSYLSEDKASAARALAAAQQTISERFGAEAVEDLVMKPSRSPKNVQTNEVISRPTDNQSTSSCRLDDDSNDSEFVQFKNLDTGEVRLFPLELVATGNSGRASDALVQRDDHFLDLFNSGSDTYQKLQCHLERLADRRQKRDKASTQSYLEDSDEDEGERSSEDDDESEDHAIGTQSRGWRRIGNFRGN